MREIFNKNGYWAQWVLAGLALVALPFVFSSGASLTMMSLMGFAIIFSLSYNMLLGQTGILSFGHAVYYGMGGFMTAHALNVVGAGKLPIPLPLIPLVGGLAGLSFAFIFGWVSTKRAGTAFSMISLGIGELVAACSLILRSFFGGEGGVSTSRTSTLNFFGINFGPQIQVYYLIAAWCLLCMAAMYFFTRTPLGRMCNAVRDNPERTEFVGYNTQMVRFIAFCASGFFIGPIIGAVLMTALQISLSDYTGAWMLYVGLMFVMVVMFAPGGLAGLLLMHKPMVVNGTFSRLLPAYGLAFLPVLMVSVGGVLVVETCYHLLVKASEGTAMHVWWLNYDAKSPWAWSGILSLLLLGAVALRKVAPRVAEAFHDAQQLAMRKGSK
jgi:branched-chain amino acid transport system permease protein